MANERKRASIVGRRKKVWSDDKDRFQIDEILVEAADGSVAPFVSFERGHSVAALIYNSASQNVILVKQLRPSVTEMEGSAAGLIETVAAGIWHNEEPLQCLQRCVKTETGYELAFDPATSSLRGTEKICEYYASPGGSSERIHLYFVTIDDAGGIRDRGEDIETVPIPIEEFFDRIDKSDFSDAKILIAGQWLAKRWENRKRAASKKHEFVFRDDQNGPHGARAPRVIGYYACDIGLIGDVDVWVNSSNSEFLMDTIYHGTLSARIRTLGGRRKGDSLVEDTIQEALVSELGIGRGMDLAQVLRTTSGALRESHNVRCLLHVSSVKGIIDSTGNAEAYTNIPALVNCVENALKEVDRMNRSWFGYSRWFGAPFRSILLPLFGAGIDRNPSQLKTKHICEQLIPAAIRHIEDNSQSQIEKIYFLAYTPTEIEICDSVMSRNASLKRSIVPVDAPSSSESGTLDTALSRRPV